MTAMTLFAPVLNIAQNTVDAFLMPINFVMRMFDHDEVEFDVTTFVQDII